MQMANQGSATLKSWSISVGKNWDISTSAQKNWELKIIWFLPHDRPWNDLLCVEWDVKPYTLTLHHEILSKNKSCLMKLLNFNIHLSSALRYPGVSKISNIIFWDHCSAFSVGQIHILMPMRLHLRTKCRTH